MRKVPQYYWGSYIQYNSDKPIAGNGSCIFMHIWRNPTAGTAGCVAMEENNLKTVLSWLDEKKEPVIAMFPQQAYQVVQKEWGLP